MSSILNADHLAEQEQAYIETGEAPEQQSPLTLADVVDRLRRIAYHKRMIAKEEEEAAQLIAPLQAEIDRIREWQKERRERRERIIQLHENACIAYYRLNPPAKGKTIKLPNGSISARQPGPKWNWQDDDAVANTLSTYAPELVRTETVVDKNKVKEATKYGLIRVVEGKVYVTRAEDGELIEVPGVTVEEQAEQITVKVEEE